jgi:hypothetical protein
MTDPVTTPRESYAFAVWRKGKPMPHQREQSLGAARDEAARQARRRPGAKIIIMQEIERVIVPKSIPSDAPRTDEPGGHPPRSPGSTISGGGGGADHG